MIQDGQEAVVKNLKYLSKNKLYSPKNNSESNFNDSNNFSNFTCNFYLARNTYGCHLEEKKTRRRKRD